MEASWLKQVTNSLAYAEKGAAGGQSSVAAVPVQSLVLGARSVDGDHFHAQGLPPDGVPLSDFAA